MRMRKDLATGEVPGGLGELPGGGQRLLEDARGMFPIWIRRRGANVCLRRHAPRTHRSEFGVWRQSEKAAVS